MTITVEHEGKVIEFPDAETANQFFARQRQSTRGNGLTQIGTFADNGRVFRKPDGSLTAVSAGGATNDQETIARIMRGDDWSEITRDSLDEQIINENEGTARLNEFTRGAPFVGEYIDEAVGLVSENAQDAMRRSTDAMRRQRPGETAALNTAGGIAYSIPAAVAVGPGIAAQAEGKSRLARMGLGGLLGLFGGGTEGAISGYGAGENPEERADKAQTYAGWGAGLGGLLGAAGPGIADAAGAAWEGVANRVRGGAIGQTAQQLGVSRPAASVLRQTFNGTDEGMVRQAVAQAGDDAMIGEVSPASRGLLDALAVRPGNARNIVNEAVEGRATRANPRLRAALDDSLGEAPVGVRSAADEIATRTGPTRAAAYEAAYSTPIDYSTAAGRNVEDVFGRVPQRVLREAVEAANEEIQSNPALRSAGVRQILADVADDGTVTFREMPNVAQIDQIKRGLQEVAYRNTDDFGRLNQAGQRYNNMARDLRDATVEATGGQDSPYAAAVAVGGDKIAQDQALEIGSRMLRRNVTREDVSRMMANATGESREAARIGIRSQIDEVMANTRRAASDPNVDARQVRDALTNLSSDANRQKIAMVIGEDEAQRLFKQIDEASAALNLRASVAENSRTAQRLLGNEALDDATAPNALQRTAAGEPLEAARAIVQTLTGETETARALRTDAVAEELARFLTQQRGRTAEVAVGYLRKAVQGQSLSEAEARVVANALATNGYFAGTSQGTRALSD
jgi:hypothetical protein